MYVMDVWVVLLPLRLSHDTSDLLNNVGFGAGENYGIECRDIQPLVRLAERREYDLLLRRFLERGLLHPAHIQSRSRGKTLVEHFAV